jgi:multidrug efflux pump subunit AcrA (membrane-fusion protein)
MNLRFAVSFAVLLAVVPAQAHEGHDHDFPGEEAAMAIGPITLSAAQIETLGIAGTEATFGEIIETLTLPAMVALPPERRASVSPLAAGQIARLFVVPGQAVKRGETVAQIEPVAVGARSFSLTAPIDGIVESLLATIGETIEIGRSIITIIDPSRVLIHGAAMESEALPRLKNGLSAKFVADIAPSVSYTGAVERLLLYRKPGETTFTVTAAFDNAAGDLAPGMTGSLHVALGEAAPAVLIPARAVLGEIADRFVFIRKGDTFERRQVILGERSGALVEVIDGVLPGDVVVTQGHYQLQFAGMAATVPSADDHDHDH